MTQLEEGQLWMNRVTGRAYRVESVLANGAKMQPVDDETHEPDGDPVGMTTAGIEAELAYVPPVEVRTGLEIGVTTEGLVSIVKDGQRMFFSPPQLLASAVTGYQACKANGIEVDMEALPGLIAALQGVLPSEG